MTTRCVGDVGRTSVRPTPSTTRPSCGSCRDGVPDDRDECPDEAEGRYGDGDGCPEGEVYYQGGRIILASFTTESRPPAGRVLVARVHLQETGHSDYAVKVMAAAAPGGERIEPKIDLVRAGGK